MCVWLELLPVMIPAGHVHRVVHTLFCLVIACPVAVGVPQS